MLAAGVPVLGSAFGLAPHMNLRVGIFIVCALAAVCMCVPVFAIDEPRYCHKAP